MEEATKRYNHPVSFWNIFLPVVVAFAVVAFLGYWSFPTIVNSVQVVIAWSDWLCVVIRNLIFVSVFVSTLVVLIYVYFHKTAEQNIPQRLAVVPPPPPPPASDLSWENCFLPAMEVNRYDDGYYNKEIVPDFETVKECNCYDQVVMEKEDSKCFRMTRSEKKARTVEYRRMESERVMKTASWKSQTMDVLSNEEFRTTVETFITEKKKMLNYHQNGVVDQRQNGVVDQWQNGFLDQWQNGVVDQRQNGVIDQWQNGVPQWPNAIANQWQNGVPQWQNAVANQWLNGVPQWQNDVVKWQGLSDEGTGRHHRHRHRSRNHRLVGDSGSTGSGSHLAITN